MNLNKKIIGLIAGMILLLTPMLSNAQEQYAIEELPEPIQRYLKFALGDSEPMVGIQMKFRGKLILPGDTKAVPVTGKQTIRADQPSFDWRAKAKFNALITAHIRDSYSNGGGSILSKLNRLYTVIDDKDIPELSKTQLTRWSGLSVMAPSAFLLKNYVTWTQTGPNQVKATIKDDENEVEQTFFFDSEGKMIRSESADRWERYDGEYKQVSTIMHRSNYIDFEGLKIPSMFSITRVEPDGSHTEFWVGSFSDFENIR